MTVPEEEGAALDAGGDCCTAARAVEARGCADRTALYVGQGDAIWGLLCPLTKKGQQVWFNLYSTGTRYSSVAGYWQSVGGIMQLVYSRKGGLVTASSTDRIQSHHCVGALHKLRLVSYNTAPEWGCCLQGRIA